MGTVGVDLARALPLVDEPDKEILIAAALAEDARPARTRQAIEVVVVDRDVGDVPRVRRHRLPQEVLESYERRSVGGLDLFDHRQRVVVGRPADAVEEVLLRVDVVVQARLRDAERVGDVGEGRRVVALCPEDAGGDAEELPFARRHRLVGAATLAPLGRSGGSRRFVGCWQ